MKPNYLSNMEMNFESHFILQHISVFKTIVQKQLIIFKAWVNKHFRRKQNSIALKYTLPFKFHSSHNHLVGFKLITKLRGRIPCYTTMHQDICFLNPLQYELQHLIVFFQVCSSLDKRKICLSLKCNFVQFLGDEKTNLISFIVLTWGSF